jgi:hypothetical protein
LQISPNLRHYTRYGESVGYIDAKTFSTLADMTWPHAIPCPSM